MVCTDLQLLGTSVYLHLSLWQYSNEQILGSYEYRFTEAKVYRYAGPPVDTRGSLVMGGIISVTEPVDRVYQLSLSINGIEARLQATGMQKFLLLL